MNKDDFLRIFEFLSTEQIIQFKRLNEQYKNYLEEKIIPLQDEETRELQSNVPQKIFDEYLIWEQQMKKENKLILSQAQHLGITRSQLKKVQFTEVDYFPNAQKMMFALEIMEEMNKQGLNKTIKERIASLNQVNKFLIEITDSLSSLLSKERVKFFAEK